MDRLTQSCVDPHSPLWRTLVDAFEPELDPIHLDQEAHTQCVVVQTTYGKRPGAPTVLKVRTIITTNPTFGPYRATTNA